MYYPLIPAKAPHFSNDLILLRKRSAHSACVGIVQEKFCTGWLEEANLGNSWRFLQPARDSRLRKS